MPAISFSLTDADSALLDRVVVRAESLYRSLGIGAPDRMVCLRPVAPQHLL